MRRREQRVFKGRRLLEGGYHLYLPSLDREIVVPTWIRAQTLENVEVALEPKTRVQWTDELHPEAPPTEEMPRAR